MRAINRPRAAYIFAKQAASLPFPAQDILFVDRGVYDWMCLDELGATSWWVHDFQSGYNACERLLREGHLPESEIPRVKNNLEQYRSKLSEIALHNQNILRLKREEEKKNINKFKKR